MLKNPYCILKLGDYEVNTEFEKHGHMTPIWKYRAYFTGNELSKMVEFQIMNYNIGKDKLLGSAKLDIS